MGAISYCETTAFEFVRLTLALHKIAVVEAESGTECLEIVAEDRPRKPSGAVLVSSLARLQRPSLHGRFFFRQGV